MSKKQKNTEESQTVGAVDLTPKVEASEETALTVQETGGELVALDFMEDAGAGMEGMTAADMAMPFLAILQKMSPQVDETSPKYIDGAKAGMIFNTLTGEFYSGKDGIVVVPCGYKKLFTEWTPREKGGGFIAHHDPSSKVVQTATAQEGTSRLLTANGNWLVDTAYYFLMFQHPETGAWTQTTLSMTSTQLKKSRKWNSLMSGLRMTSKGKTFNPPMFSHMYKMTTKAESNDKGTWYGWEIVVVSPIQSPDLYAEAKKFHASVIAGEVQAGAPPVSDDAGAAGNGDVPF